MSEFQFDDVSHTEFRNSPVGRIPKDWLVRKVREFLSQSKDKGKKGLPIYSVLLKGGMVARTTLERRIASTLKLEDNLFVHKGDLVYNMMRMWQGASGIAPVNCIVSPAYVVCRPNDGIVPEFLGYLMKSSLSIQALHRYSQGLTGDRLRLYFENFGQMSFPLPSREEQQKIASILTSVDEVIEKTEAQIGKLQDLKNGMMQKLLTQGIGHTEFKDSLVGRIPTGWEVCKLDRIGSFKNGVNKGKEEFGYGLPFVNISDAYQEYLDTSKLGRLNATDKEVSDYGLQNGDIIFVRSSVKPTGVGFPILFEANTEPTLFCGFMIRFRLAEKDIHPGFLLQYFRNESFRTEIMKVATISANTNVNQTALSNLYVALPPLQEQISISNKMNSTINYILSKQILVSEYTQIKKALMQDLLTGKVRVKVN